MVDLLVDPHRSRAGLAARTIFKEKTKFWSFGTVPYRTWYETYVGVEQNVFALINIRESFSTRMEY